MTDTVTLCKFIRFDEADEYERDGWTVTATPPSHHCRHKHFIATKAVPAGEETE